MRDIIEETKLAAEHNFKVRKAWEPGTDPERLGLAVTEYGGIWYKFAVVAKKNGVGRVEWFSTGTEATARFEQLMKRHGLVEET